MQGKAPGSSLQMRHISMARKQSSAALSLKLSYLVSLICQSDVHSQSDFVSLSQLSLQV